MLRLIATESRFSSGNSVNNTHTVWCNEQDTQKAPWNSLLDKLERWGLHPSSALHGITDFLLCEWGVQLPLGPRFCGCWTAVELIHVKLLGTDKPACHPSLGNSAAFPYLPYKKGDSRVNEIPSREHRRVFPAVGWWQRGEHFLLLLTLDH